jgi:Rieske Fe-S protein
MNSHVPEKSPEPGRRSFLKMITYGLGAAFGATLGVPALAYLLDPRHRPAPPGDFKDVAKLSELKEGVPFEATIREVRRDAWTLHPNDIVGRVWLVKQKDGSVKSWTTTCPHLGCSVNWEGDKFVCPCHNGTFNIDGVRADPGTGRTNPAPRDMDALELKLADDPEDAKDKIVQVKFETFYQNSPEKTVRS